MTGGTTFGGRSMIVLANVLVEQDRTWTPRSVEAVG